MSAITCKGALCTGHGHFPPRTSIAGSPSVFVNDAGINRVGDAWAAHYDDQGHGHDGRLTAGSTSVFANGKPFGRTGDPISCGSRVASGSNNVFAGN